MNCSTIATGLSKPFRNRTPSGTYLGCDNATHIYWITPTCSAGRACRNAPQSERHEHDCRIMRDLVHRVFYRGALNSLRIFEFTAITAIPSLVSLHFSVKNNR